MTPGETIRARRIKRGLTQTELAELLGVHWRTVQDWERGIWLPRGTTAVALKEVLGGKIEDYLQGVAHGT